MMKDLKADLAADLAADLSRAAPPALAAPKAVAATPAVTVTLTPLQWSRPSLDAPRAATGMAVRVGPWRVEVAL